MTHVDTHLILWPMAVLGGLTLSVLMIMPLARVASVSRRQARVSDFRLGESDAVPENVRVINRNYMNLLELPVLFYVACLIAFTGGYVTPLTLGLAWGFVALRAAHSLVHLTVNIVLLRLALFASAATALLALWVAVMWQVAGK